MRMSFPLSLAAALLAAATASAQEQQAATPKQPDDARLIRSAQSAAPKAVSDTATVVAMGEQGQMRTLKEGTGQFTCLPDVPTTPGNDPMCVDRNGLEWVKAWIGHQPPPQGKVGLAYMLQGGSDASNTDPFATAPKQGEKWIETGPHIMVLNAPELNQGYPTEPGNARAPFVMFPDTPYAHVMIPTTEGGKATAAR